MVPPRAGATGDEPNDVKGDVWRLAIVGALLIAFVLRAHRLDAMSLWSDEDITADRAALTVRELLADLPAEHTPVYFLSMIPWTAAAGGSDFALRYASLLAGVLAVAAAAALGAMLVGRRAAAVLAAVMAVNPFLVWYGQEARMYALLSALGLLALAAALVARRTTRRRWWVATGALAALTVLVHYYGALTVAVLTAWAVLDWWSSRRSPNAACAQPAPRAVRSGWLTAAAVALLVFAPWLPRAGGLLDYPGWREPVALADVPRINLVAWTAGETAAPEWTPVVLALYLVLAGAGALALAVRARDRRLTARFALAFVLAPLAIAALAVVRQPDFHPRYFTAVAPALYLWAAAGAVRWNSRVLRAAAAAALVLVAAPSLARMYADPAAQKQDYRTWVAAVESRAGHEDTVLFIDGPSYGLARRYEMEDSPVKIVNLRSSGNLEQRPAERVAEIAELAAEYPHLWLATAGNSLGEAETWLGQNAVSVDEPLGFQAITLRRYQSADSPTTLQAAEAAAEATFMCTAGTELCLAIGAPDRVPAGAVLPVALRWRPPANAWVSLRLVAEDGTVIAAADSPVPPQNPALSEWDGVGLTRIGLSVPDGASGQGRVEVHVYTPTGGEMGRFQGPRVILTEPDPGA